MSFANAGMIDRRDAAVASALAGMVVVLLGYASGLGIQTSNASTVPSVPGISAAPPSVTAPGATTTPPQAPAVAAHGATTGSDHHAASTRHTTGHSGTTDPHADPTTPHTPAPTTQPTWRPNPPATTCPPGVLEGLPVAGSVVSSVSSLLTPVLGSPKDQSGPLACTVGIVLGPNCCATTTATRTDSSR